MGRRSKKNRAIKRKKHSLAPSRRLKAPHISPDIEAPAPPPETDSPAPSATSRLTRLERWLFYLVIFLVPSNLAYHFYTQEAYVHGILVDYLIPKLYLSDFPILLLLFIWFLKLLYRFFKHPPSDQLTSWLKSTAAFTLFLLIAALVASSADSIKPLASFWFLAKLVELSLFIAWLYYHRPTLANYAKPFLFTAVFQSAIAILQWIQKQSLLGYLFLGESSLRTTSHIAKTAITGELRPLPYGTTSHPNVLAGFLVLAFIIKLLSDRLYLSPPKSWSRKLLSVFLFLLYFLTFTLALLLTQSFSAVIALLIGLALLAFRSVSKTSIIALMAVAVTASLLATTFVDLTSIERRVQLSSIALDMIQAHPLIGVGLNNFAASLPEFGQIRAYTRFYQPVHNIYLLWVAETGLMGTVTFLLFLAQLTRNKTFITGSFQLTIPLIMLLVIGLADHYPLSLQSGQLLLTLSIGILFSRLPSSEHVNK